MKHFTTRKEVIQAQLVDWKKEDSRIGSWYKSYNDLAGISDKAFHHPQNQIDSGNKRDLLEDFETGYKKLISGSEVDTKMTVEE